MILENLHPTGRRKPLFSPPAVRSQRRTTVLEIESLSGRGRILPSGTLGIQPSIGQ